MVRNFLIRNTVEVIFVLLQALHEYPKVWWLCDMKHVTITLIMQHNKGTSEHNLSMMKQFFMALP